MTKPSLKAVLESGQFVAAPGVHDMITAKVANKVGFDFVFASGYWMTASAYGLPDAGIATYTQMVDRVGTLCEACDAGVIADADTGYGGLLNVHHTVRGYEEVGVSAIQLEDQEFPKKCGHTPYKRVVETEEMVQKIKVACEARRSSETLIIARTDAKQPHGFEAALERCQAYAEAGADIIFFEAPESEDEMRRACAAIDKPMLANMATGGITPILPVDRLKAVGYAIALFPAMAPLAAAAAAEQALLTLKQTGVSEPEGQERFSFEEFNHLIGFPDVWAFDKKWALTGD